MAAAEYTRGRTISVKPTPDAINYFALADRFGWPPDVVDRQPYKKLKGVIHVLSIHTNIRNQEVEKMNKKNKTKKIL